MEKTEHKHDAKTSHKIIKKSPSGFSQETMMLLTTVAVVLTCAALVIGVALGLQRFGNELSKISTNQGTQNSQIAALNTKLDDVSTKVAAGGKAAPAAPAEDNGPVNGSTNIADGAIKGDKNKVKVAVVEFSDYECPFCKRHIDQVYPSILKDYVDTGKIIYVYRNNPLPFHEPNATDQAMAGECAKDQGKFWEMHDIIFKTTTSNKGISKETLLTFPAKIGLNQTTFNTCFNANKYADRIKADVKDAAASGNSGTPGFVIGKYDAATGKVEGEVIKGAYPYTQFQTTIDKFLK